MPWTVEPEAMAISDVRQHQGCRCCSGTMLLIRDQGAFMAATAGCTLTVRVSLEPVSRGNC